MTKSRPLWPAYLAESMSSVGATMLTVGIFFFTEHYYHWKPVQNFLLAAGQGSFYVAGSLAAQHVAARFGRRRGLIGLFLLLTVVPLLALAARQHIALLVPVLLCYTLITSMNWPALESLISTDAPDPHALSRRIGVYNLVWAGTNAVTFAVTGLVIQHWPAGLFLLPAAAHFGSAAVLYRVRAIDVVEVGETASEQPEPRLLAQRTLAMWLARISLPATYVVIYSLMAMMPSLAVMQPLDTAARTALGSIWMGARWFTFLSLGATAWWHTRPRVLLFAAIAMLVAFIGVTSIPNVSAMIGAQLLLGASIGLIYAASLYFGMVLSEGSTEHGGYHEALIGLGSVLGPGAAALAQWLHPGDLRFGVGAVSSIVALSVLAAGVAIVRANRNGDKSV